MAQFDGTESAHEAGNSALRQAYFKVSGEFWLLRVRTPRS